MVITSIMDDRNITKYRLAKNTGIPYTTISDICSGKAQLEKCSVETVYKIAKELGVSIETLIEPYMEERLDFELFKSNTCHRLKELGDKIRSSFAVDFCENAKVTRTSLGGYQCEYLVELDEEKDINFFELEEDITQGQRVESFRILRRKDGLWDKVYSNYTTIGNKRIIEEDVQCDAFKIVVEASRGEPIISKIAAY